MQWCEGPCPLDKSDSAESSCWMITTALSNIDLNTMTNLECLG